MKNKAWHPPFYLYLAGRESVSNTSYYNDTRKDGKPRRLLVKHTLSGRGALYDGKKRFEICPGEIFLIERPGPYIYCYEDEAEPWVFEYFSIGLDCPGPVLPPYLRKNPVFRIRDTELHSMFAELVERRLAGDFKPDLMRSALAYRFFLAYINIRMSISKPVPAPAEKLRDMLKAGFVSELLISDCCRELGYSVEALTRLFSSNYGISPGRYLQNLRLAEACRLLKEDGKSIKALACECGFNSQNYFTRIFRRAFGITPGMYRRNPDPLLLERIVLF